MRIGVLLVGLLLLAFYGWKAFELRVNEPTPPTIIAQMTAAEIETANQTFESERTKWNNQFARKGFFALIGLFLVLLMVFQPHPMINGIGARARPYLPFRDISEEGFGFNYR